MARVKANGNRVVLQQAAFTFIGLCTMLLTAATLFPQSVVYTVRTIEITDERGPTKLQNNKYFTLGSDDLLPDHGFLRRLFHHDAWADRL